MFQTIGNEFIKRARASNDPIDRSSNRRRIIHLGVDVPLLLATATIVIFGMLMVYSASWDYSFQLYGSYSRIFTRQLIWLGLGIIAALILAFVDYRWWRRLALPAMLVTIVLLIAVLFLGEVRNNAVRTLVSGSIQPSELAKLVTLIYLGVWLYSKQDRLSDVSFGLVPLGGILGIVGGLIFIQPDLSATLTIFLMGGILFFLAGGDLKQIAILAVFALLAGGLVVLVSPTGAQRMIDYVHGLLDPTQASYHVQRSLEAFVNGGWLGVGIGNGKAKLTGLPVPPTDSIFAVVGEEAGILGSVGLVGLYIVILWRGLGISRRAPDHFGVLLAAGLSLWLALEAFVNMSVMLNLLPFAGNALPFISAGGSNLVVSLSAIGILMNISRLSLQKKDREGSIFSAVINLRWRDRRRRVPRANRFTGLEN
jgi:cell division protein FtsW